MFKLPLLLFLLVISSSFAASTFEVHRSCILKMIQLAQVGVKLTDRQQSYMAKRLNVVKNSELLKKELPPIDLDAIEDLELRSLVREFISISRTLINKRPSFEKPLGGSKLKSLFKGINELEYLAAKILIKVKIYPMMGRHKGNGISRLVMVNYGFGEPNHPSINHLMKRFGNFTDEEAQANYNVIFPEGGEIEISPKKTIIALDFFDYFFNGSIGSYIREENILRLSPIDFIDQFVFNISSVTAKHEYAHLHFYNLEKEGHHSPYFFHFYTENKPLPFTIYENFYNGEELYTWLRTIYWYAERMRLFTNLDFEQNIYQSNRNINNPRALLFDLENLMKHLTVYEMHLSQFDGMAMEVIGKAFDRFDYLKNATMAQKGFLTPDKKGYIQFDLSDGQMLKIHPLALGFKREEILSHRELQNRFDGLVAHTSKFSSKDRVKNQINNELKEIQKEYFNRIIAQQQFLRTQNRSLIHNLTKQNENLVILRELLMDFQFYFARKNVDPADLNFLIRQMKHVRKSLYKTVKMQSTVYESLELFN